MKKKLPISLRRSLKGLGDSLKKARLRRRLKMVTIADRAGVSRETLAKIQKGDPGVSMGNYAAVIFALGLGTDWMNLADISEDKVGQALDDERLPTRVRETKS
ncbi:MAG: helix-turn-helix domain-containing protein [Desulfovibrio sp.]